MGSKRSPTGWGRCRITFSFRACSTKAGSWARLVLPVMTSASKAAACSGKAWGKQPQSTRMLSGFFRRSRWSSCRAFLSDIPVTVQELITSTWAVSPSTI